MKDLLSNSSSYWRNQGQRDEVANNVKGEVNAAIHEGFEETSTLKSSFDGRLSTKDGI
jgi:hypothetical protein